MREYEVNGSKIDRYMEWGCYDGRKTRILDMDDSYLANLHDFLTNRLEMSTAGDQLWNNDHSIMMVIQELQEERGLKKEFMDRAQIPYKNNKGQWEIWDHDKGGPLVLERDEHINSHTCSNQG